MIFPIHFNASYNLCDWWNLFNKVTSCGLYNYNDQVLRQTDNHHTFSAVNLLRVLWYFVTIKNGWILLLFIVKATCRDCWHKHANMTHISTTFVLMYGLAIVSVYTVNALILTCLFEHTKWPHFSEWLMFVDDLRLALPRCCWEQHKDTPLPN